MVGLQLRQELRLAQQLVMTPQLQLSIKLLQVTQLELADMVQRELVENPVLEEGDREEGATVEDRAAWEEADRAGHVPLSEGEAAGQEGERDQRTENKVDNELDWARYLENRSNERPLPSNRGSSEELPSLEATLSSSTSLFDHLAWQIRMANLLDSEARFALLVAGNLDRDGYLSRDVTLEELAEEAGLLAEDAEEVLALVQQLDPVGVGARDLRECLLAQVRSVERKGDVLSADVEAIIDEHLDDLERRRYGVIAKALDASLEDVFEAMKAIAQLEPRPGRRFTSEVQRYVTPDVHVHLVGGRYMVVSNDDDLPRLKISSYYRSALAGDRASKDYIKSKLRSAQWLIQSIDQRRRTIIKVTECIVEKQRAFFDKGVSHLQPMILRDVADAIGMHESTVSRVTNGKYVATPRGIFELKYFFNPGIRRNRDSDVASESVKQEIKLILDKEDRRKPISDQKVVELLSKKLGIVIARRTVAKYRSLLGVPSSAQRRQVF